VKKKKSRILNEEVQGNVFSADTNMWEFTFEFGERYKVHYTNGFRYNRLENVKKIIIFNKEMYEILISPMKTMPHYCILLFIFPVQRAKYET